MKILGPEVGYTDLLDLAITEKLQKEADEEAKGNFLYSPLRPSAAGYCARRLAYATAEYRGHGYVPKELKSPETYRLLELGHAVEFSALKNFQLLKVMQVKFRQQALAFSEVARGDKDLEREILIGNADFVLWNPKHKALGDVKSKKDKFSSSYKTGWDEDTERFASMDSLIQVSETAFYADDLDELIEELGDDFIVDNLYQINLYAMNDFMQKIGVNHAFVYQYNKNDSRHREIRFRPSAKAAKYVEKKFNAISKAVDKKEVESIERDFVLGSMRCAFCPYSKKCWGGDDALRAWFNSFPKKSWPTDVADAELVACFDEYEKALTVQETVAKLEADILKRLGDLKKVRLPNGNVYETKYLKSPHPHLELRRSKA